jgi:hypothetical protein
MRQSLAIDHNDRRERSRRQPAPVIHPNAVYTMNTLRRALGLRPGSLPRALRRAELRYAKRCGRNFILGSWVLHWLEGGEVTRAPRAAAERNGRRQRVCATS